MAIAEIIGSIFLFIIAFGMLYMGFKRNDETNITIGWFVMSTILFGALALSSATIPFVTDSTGATIPGTLNVLMSGVAWLFMFVSLAFSVKTGIEMLNREGIRM